MQFTLHTDFNELGSISAEWNELLVEGITNVPFLRHEYLSTWWATRGGGEWPFTVELVLVTAHQDGHLAGIAPLFKAVNQEGEPTLLFLGSVEISDYLDLIVRPSNLDEFLSGLLDFLAAASLGWNRLDWANLPEASPTISSLQALSGMRGWNCSVHQTYHAPAIPLPGDFETYLAGIDKKQRHEIRRKMRRGVELGGVDWYIVKDGSILEAEMEAFLALMATDQEKASFLTDAMRRQMHATAQAAYKEGWLQLSFLTVDGQKAAAYLNFDYHDRIWVYNSGIDWKFMGYSPGWVLLGYLLQWANENKRKEFDFMRGEEDYKYRFGGVDKLVMRVKVAR